MAMNLTYTRIEVIHMAKTSSYSFTVLLPNSIGVLLQITKSYKWQCCFSTQHIENAKFYGKIYVYKFANPDL